MHEEVKMLLEEYIALAAEEAERVAALAEAGEEDDDEGAKLVATPPELVAKLVAILELPDKFDPSSSVTFSELEADVRALLADAGLRDFTVEAGLDDTMLQPYLDRKIHPFNVPKRAPAPAPAPALAPAAKDGGGSDRLQMLSEHEAVRKDTARSETEDGGQWAEGMGDAWLASLQGSAQDKYDRYVKMVREGESKDFIRGHMAANNLTQKEMIAFFRAYPVSGGSARGAKPDMHPGELPAFMPKPRAAGNGRSQRGGPQDERNVAYFAEMAKVNKFFLLPIIPHVFYTLPDSSST